MKPAGARFFLALVALLATALPSAAAEHIKIGVVRSNGGIPAIIAKEKGYFAAEGVEADVIFFDSAQPISVAVASGDCDFGSTGITAAFYNLAAQGALKIIAAGTWDKRGFQSVGMIVSNQAYAAGLHSFKDLGGHSVAITQRGSPLELFVVETAQVFHIDPATIKFQALQSNGVVASAVVGNQVDAAVQTAAPSYAIVEKGDAKILGWFSDVLSGRQGEAIFTSAKVANERPEAVRGFLAGIRKAMVYWDNAFVDAKGDRQDGPNSAEAIALVAKQLNQPESVVRAGIPYYDPQARISMKDMAVPLAWYKSQNMVKPNVELAPMVDNRYAIEVPEK
ncbi:MAG TPA: ABC transporter substrate-binding protein [Stellaceae bacterium]|jgi:NitT/TauT family transport system substrate-binding protein|nr:ABC transporter substrate-binding protein [Stellaceae bacterium]